MSVSYSYLTGHPGQILPSTIRRVGAFTRITKIKKFKIGISNNPDRRWLEEYKYSYDDMIVIYGSNSIDHVSSLEYFLVNLEVISCDNLIAGGGGNIGRPPYYLYLVRKNWS